MNIRDVEFGKVYQFSTKGGEEGIFRPNGWAWDNNHLDGDVRSNKSDSENSTGWVLPKELTKEVKPCKGKGRGYAKIGSAYYPLPGTEKEFITSTGDVAEVGRCYEYVLGKSVVGIALLTEQYTDPRHPIYVFKANWVHTKISSVDAYPGQFTLAMLGKQVLDVPHAPTGPAYVNIDGKVFRNPHYTAPAKWQPTIGKVYWHQNGFKKSRVKVDRINGNYLSGAYTFQSVPYGESFGGTGDNAHYWDGRTLEEAPDIFLDGWQIFCGKSVKEFLDAKRNPFIVPAATKKFRFTGKVSNGQGWGVVVVEAVSREEAIKIGKAEAAIAGVTDIDWNAVRFEVSEI